MKRVHQVVARQKRCQCWLGRINFSTSRMVLYAVCSLSTKRVILLTVAPSSGNGGRLGWGRC